MKKVLSSSIIALMVLFFSAGLGLARNGGGAGVCGCGGGSCLATGTSLICSGVPVTITGVVSQENYRGSGLQVDTGSEVVTVHGIGPYWYWENAGMDRPMIGDAVTIDGMEVTFSDGSTRIITISITMEDKTISLRTECVADVGGWPLWRAGGKNN